MAWLYLLIAGALEVICTTLYRIIGIVACGGAATRHAMMRRVEPSEVRYARTLDGVHIATPRWWVHLRKSNTEPIVRVILDGSCPRPGLPRDRRIDMGAASIIPQLLLNAPLRSP